MVRRSKESSAPIYQLKVTLRDLRPPVWRRLQVPGDVTLTRLHYLIQIAMGWTNSHLHQFQVGGEYYSDPTFELEEALSERRAKLQQVAPDEKSKFRYTYDFGDSWEHEILVEKILPPEPDVQYPRCVAGARACPPEDSGGVWGYADMVKAIADPKHPERADYLEWLGGEFDPEAFDIEEVNRSLQDFR
jgi:hypothetical protein